jgi:hypothetical protein
VQLVSPAMVAGLACLRGQEVHEALDDRCSAFLRVLTENNEGEPFEALASL